MNVNTELTDKRFVVNLINTCVSISILSMPFAFSISQFYSIISMIMAFILTNYAAYCITKVTLCAYDLHETVPASTSLSCENDYELSDLSETNIVDEETTLTTDAQELTSSSNPQETEHEPQTDNSSQSVYAIISYKALGKVGAVYVTLGMILMCTIFLVNILVMNWKLLNGIISIFTTDYNDNIVYLYVIVITIPSVFVLNWKSLTIMGWVTVFSVTITTLIMICIFIRAQINFKQTNGTLPASYFDGIDKVNTSQYASDNMSTISVIFFSFLTFVAALGGNELVVMMVISAKNKELKHIMKLICISYGIVAIFYTCLGFIGQHIYGAYTHILILNNLFYWSLDDIITPIVMSSIMMMNLFASFCIWSAAESDTIQGMLNIKSDDKCKRILLRLFLLISSGLIGFFVRDILSLLIAVQSCISVIFGADLVLPIALYLGMFWKKIIFISKIFHILLLFFIIGMATLVAIQAITELRQ
eukprot:482703_1